MVACVFANAAAAATRRHERYENQFRAIFVQNCRVRRDERLVFPRTTPKRQRGGGRGRPSVVPDAAAAGPAPEDVFNPVSCKHCGTEVGFLDSDDVYHFCDVFPNPSPAS
jgi:hypothetical protein